MKSSPIESSPFVNRGPRDLFAAASLSVDAFMRQYWQRRPLVLRAAFPNFQAPVSSNEVRRLAEDEGVESRLIGRRGGRWTVEHGPFAAEDLPSPRRRNWTLLVQGVDRQLDAAHDLLARFRFLGDARLDDLMISIAGDGGGVGPHVDSYDVFLLQAEGRRRWRLAPPAGGEPGRRTTPPALVPGLPLKILADFAATEQHDLEPGDMLYLPPGWGHDGVALGPCMTYSIGFRAPTRHEFLRAWLAECADAPEGPDPRHRDPREAATRHPAQLPGSLVDTLQTWARTWRPSPAAISRFIGRFVTEPHPTVFFERPDLMQAKTWRVRARRHGLILDRCSRMAYRGSTVFINGEDWRLPGTLWRHLADARQLAPGPLCALPDADPGWATLQTWWAQGWLRIGSPPGALDAAPRSDRARRA